jgi:hypothetical protein
VQLDKNSFIRAIIYNMGVFYTSGTKIIQNDFTSAQCTTWNCLFCSNEQRLIIYPYDMHSSERHKTEWVLQWWVVFPRTNVSMSHRKRNRMKSTYPKPTQETIKNSLYSVSLENHACSFGDLARFATTVVLRQPEHFNIPNEDWFLLWSHTLNYLYNSLSRLDCGFQPRWLRSKMLVQAFRTKEARNNDMT